MDRLRRSFVPRLEVLEDRTLMAGIAGGSVSLPFAQALVDDVYEQNDSRAAAHDLGAISASRSVCQLVQADSNDWYRFTLASRGTTGNKVAIGFQHTQGDLDMQLYDSRGRLLRTSGGTGDGEQISLSGTAAGVYYIRVYGYRGAANPSYGLDFTVTPPLLDDAYENNDSRTTARNLGTLTGSTAISSLVLADTQDWFRFTTTGRGAVDASVSISFQHAQGNFALELYSSSGSRLATSNGTGNGEAISLSGRAAGTYYLRVLGSQNPSYNLQINPTVAAAPSPPPTAPPSADDAYENNDSRSQASNLDTIANSTTVPNLVLADTQDWFRFATTERGGPEASVSISFQHAQGNLALELYSATGSRLARASGTGNGETISLSGRPAATYYVRVLGSKNPSYSLQIIPTAPLPAPPPPPTTPPSGAFDIQFVYSGLSATQQAIFDDAAARWEAVIVGDLPEASYNGQTVDDLLIDASSIAIDGPGNILGQAGPDRFRSGSQLPYHGEMEFDTADLAAMQADGSLLSVIVHEIGHVLGIGTLWESKGLVVGVGTSNPRYVGPQALAEYNSIFGVTSTGVPLENSGGPGTRDAHWRETLFRNEIMTGFINSGANPLTRVTAASLGDLGYSVKLAAADAFIPPGGSSSFLTSSNATSGWSSAVIRPLELHSWPSLDHFANRLTYIARQFDVAGLRESLAESVPTRSTIWESAVDRYFAEALDW